jgi:hypothetical protein
MRLPELIAKVISAKASGYPALLRGDHFSRHQISSTAHLNRMHAPSMFGVHASPNHVAITIVAVRIIVGVRIAVAVPIGIVIVVVIAIGTEA